MSLAVSKLQLLNINDVEQYLNRLSDIIKYQENKIKELDNEINKNKRSIRTELKTVSLSSFNTVSPSPLTYFSNSQLYVYYLQNRSFYGLDNNKNVVVYSFLYQPDDTPLYLEWSVSNTDNAYNGWYTDYTSSQYGIVQINSISDNNDGSDTSTIYGTFIIKNTNETFPLEILVGLSAASAQTRQAAINSVQINGTVFTTDYRTVRAADNIGAIVPSTGLALYPYIIYNIPNNPDYTEWSYAITRSTLGNVLFTSHIYVKFLFNQRTNQLDVVMATVSPNSWVLIEAGQLYGWDNNFINIPEQNSSNSITTFLDNNKSTTLTFVSYYNGTGTGGNNNRMDLDIHPTNNYAFNFTIDGASKTVSLQVDGNNATQGFGGISNYSLIPNNWYEESVYAAMSCVPKDC